MDGFSQPLFTTFRVGEEDYDDLPGETDIPSIPEKKSLQKGPPAATRDVATREFEDYDDPIRQILPPHWRKYRVVQIVMEKVLLTSHWDILHTKVSIKKIFHDHTDHRVVRVPSDIQGSRYF